MIRTSRPAQLRLALLALCGLVSGAWAQPVLITSPQTVGPEQTHITPTAGGDPVPLATAELTIRGTTLTMNGRHQIASLVVEPEGAAAGVVTHSNAFTWDYSGSGADVVSGLHLTVVGDVLIEEGGRIDATARGYVAGQGPGSGGTSGNRRGGGGHGGRGGAGPGGGGSGGTYGDFREPTLLGSGAGRYSSWPGGSGGGAVRLTVSGELRVDGAVSADGQNNNQGGGSGGSVLIACETLTGTGRVTANGGVAIGANDGGGGGGRIAIYTCNAISSELSITADGGTGWQNGEPGTIYFGQLLLEARPVAATVCSGDTATLHARSGGGGQVTDYQWLFNNKPITDGVTPWGSVITGSQTDTLTIENTQPEDAGYYSIAADSDCGTAVSLGVALDIYCDCDAPAPIIAGIDDNFAMPPEPTDPSVDLERVLLERRPNRPFHIFDQIPGVTPGVGQDSRLAHTFTDLPQSVVGASLTMRLKAGGDGTTTPVAEGTDSIRIGFTTPDSTAPDRHDIYWTRRIAGTQFDPNFGLLPGQIWTSGDVALLTLDLRALPMNRPLGDPTGQTMSVIGLIRDFGFFDVTVVDETGVDFMQLDLQTSSGEVTPWAFVPGDDIDAAECDRVELGVVTGDAGGPFTYQWRLNGQPIDPADNPSAATDTLVIEQVAVADDGIYDCVVSGEQTCGDAISNPIVLSVGTRCIPDLNGDGIVDADDFFLFLQLFAAGDMRADMNCDNLIDADDFFEFLALFAAGCP